MTYRTKNKKVEAFQLTKENRHSNLDWPHWMHKAWNYGPNTKGSIYGNENVDDLFVVTENGTETVHVGEWIVLHGEDDMSVMTDENFNEEYRYMEDSICSRAHIVIDLETLSTKSNAMITSIGLATVFQKGTDIRVSDVIYERNISMESYSKYDGEFHMSPQTIEWWMGQSKEAQDAMFTNPVPLEVALQSILTYILSLDDSYEIFVYGFGSTFDIPILEHAFSVTGMTVPWTYRNVRCLRTLCNIFGINYNEYIDGAKHRAGVDALAEAKALKEILSRV